MKRILLTSAVCMALISPAYAWGTDVPTPVPAPVYNTNITKNWASYLTAAASQQQSQASSNSNRNHNVANGGNGYGGTSTVTFQANRALAASAYAPSFAGSAPCAGKAQSGGLQIPWVGASEGSQGLDDACRLERNGDRRGARYLLCNEDENIRKALYQESQDDAVSGKIADPCPDDREKFAKWWWGNQHNEPTAVSTAPEQPKPFTKPDWCLHQTTKSAKAFVAIAASCQ